LKINQAFFLAVSIIIFQRFFVSAHFTKTHIAIFKQSFTQIAFFNFAIKKIAGIKLTFSQATFKRLAFFQIAIGEFAISYVAILQMTFR
jgi:hypothetical protein